MIRERRNKEKLAIYYQKFMTEGIVDPNVHPWIAESWRRCRTRGLDSVQMRDLPQLNAAELNERYENNKAAIGFVDGLYERNKQCFNNYNLNLLLIDEESYVLRNYDLPRFQDFLANVQGSRLSERDIGTSSISIAREHKVPFLLFGPEMWLQDAHSGDACAAPVIVDGCLRYVLCLFSLEQDDLPYDLIVSLLLNMQYSLENYLLMQEKNAAFSKLFDELPMSVYCVRPGGRTTYANAGGLKRLEGNSSLSDVFLNYEHIPINKGFQGMPSSNKEVVWIARDRTYEDITTVLPLRTCDEVSSVIVASFSVEDLKTIIAHATGYSSRYSLLSMVGETGEFTSLQNKAARVAKGDSNVLLQGEPGTGKQRLAHGIHQASPRAANPLIVVKCGKVAESILAAEIFGYGEESTGWVPGKLELANTGTLFIDEVEKLPVAIGDRLARVLTDGLLFTHNEAKKIDVRLIAACDSNLKRLSEKGLFSQKMFAILSKVTIRVPSLRDRVEDIEILSGHILSEMAMQHNLPPKHLSPEALAVLEKCTWTGNIKQLQSVLEMAFFHTPGAMINADNIKLPGDCTVGKSWKYDKDAFVEAWKAAGGNISRLGLMLDVSRVTLYRYLRKYGLGKEAEKQ